MTKQNIIQLGGRRMESEVIRKMHRRIIKSFMDILILGELKNNIMSGYDVIAYIHNMRARTLQVTLTLSVSSYIEGISSFSFDITIIGDNLSGDANGDNIVDFFDLIKPHFAYGSTPGDSMWNPDADLNNDDVVDIFDVVTVTSNFGKTA